MLNLKIFLFNFIRFIQTGLYLDFIIKNITEVFVKNIFVYTSQFFGEKYLIEYLTKKLIETWIFNLNKNFFFFELFHFYFFIQILTIIFYFIIFYLIIFF